MFAKLKKKLQDETGSEGEPIPSPGGARLITPTGRDGSGESSPLSASSFGKKIVASARNLSFTNLSSPEESSKEEVLAMLVRRTDQCKKLEAKISEYSMAMKDKNKLIEKMEGTLEKQQDAASTRTRELSEQAEKSHLHFMDKMKGKNDEISELRDMVAALENSSSENRTEEVKQLHNQLAARTKEKEELSLETILLTTQVEDAITACEQYKGLNSELEWAIKQITEDRDTHKADSVDRCAEIFTLTQNLAAESERAASLNHDLSLANRMIEERDADMTKCQERIDTLEQRLMGQSLNGSEREQALELERESLERKIADMERQHSTTKATMYEKITALEKQVTDLQTSLSESEDKTTDLLNQRQQSVLAQTALSDSLSQLKISHESSQSVLQQNISALELQISQHITENTSLSHKVASLEAMLLEQTTEGGKATESVADLTHKLHTAQDTIVEKIANIDMLKSELSLSRLNTDQLSLRVHQQQGEISDLKLANDQSEKAAQSHVDQYISSNQSISQENDELLLRNAQLSQQLTTIQQALRAELTAKEATITQLTIQVDELGSHKAETENLQESHSQLTDQVNEKNKMIKNLQQRLADVKKALQRELRVQAAPCDDASDIAAGPAVLSLCATPPAAPPTTSMITLTYPQYSTSQPFAAVPPLMQTPPPPMSRDSYFSKISADIKPPKVEKGKTIDDLDFRYLKHVIIKFILSQESEAVKLVAAVSALLQLTREETRLVQETLEWKMSWFGSRPDQGHMQSAKAIYPSY